MKTTGLFLLMALSVASFAASSLVPASAQAQSNVSAPQKRTLKTVIDSKMESGGGNGFIIKCQGNGGSGLNIIDAMSFSADQLNSLDESMQNRTAVTLVIQGTTIVDIQK